MKNKLEIVRQLSMVTQIGLSILAPIILCIFTGNWLDQKFGWNTTVVLLLLGILAGVRNCWMLLKKLQGLEDKKKND